MTSSSISPYIESPRQSAPAARTTNRAPSRCPVHSPSMSPRRLTATALPKRRCAYNASRDDAAPQPLRRAHRRQNWCPGGMKQRRKRRNFAARASLSRWQVHRFFISNDAHYLWSYRTCSQIYSAAIVKIRLLLHLGACFIQWKQIYDFHGLQKCYSILVVEC
jgi:hypothetical protein